MLRRGAAALELCAVAEGAAACWADVSRGVTHPHDLAAASVTFDEPEAQRLRSLLTLG